jgi:hypothetical protein
MTPVAQTVYRNLLPFRLMDGAIQLTEVELFEEPPSPLALVSYTEDGVAQELGLRLDLGKLCFLDIDPFEKLYGEAEGRRRANVLAEELVKNLAQPLSAGTHGD